MDIGDAVAVDVVDDVVGDAAVKADTRIDVGVDCKKKANGAFDVPVLRGCGAAGGLFSSFTAPSGKLVVGSLKMAWAIGETIAGSVSRRTTTWFATGPKPKSPVADTRPANSILLTCDRQDRAAAGDSPR